MSIELHYSNPEFNGEVVYTVLASEEPQGRQLFTQRFNLLNTVERAHFARNVAQAAGNSQLTGEVEKALSKKASESSRTKSVSALRPSRVIRAYQPFPTDRLPHAMARFIREGGKAIGCDESFIALPLLVGLGMSIGAVRRIRVKWNWYEYPILWAVVIAASGQRKTPPFYAALAPLHKRQTQAFQQHKAQLQEYKAAVLEYKRDVATYRTEGGSPPIEPERPYAKRYIVNDSTVEALALLLEHAPRGLALVRDELSGWLASFNQYKSGGKGSDTANWLQMHNAGVVTIDRKTGDRTTIAVPRAAVGIAGTIQPRIFTKCLGKEHFENGMAARLLVAMPPARQRVWSDDSIEQLTGDRVDQVYERLLSLGFGADGEPIDVPLTAQAQAAFVHFVNAHGQEQHELDDEDLSAAWSKLEGYAARLALIIQYVKWASEPRDTPEPRAIDESSMHAAIALTQWFGNEAMRVYTGVHQNDDERDRQHLINLIREEGGKATPRDLQKRCRRYPKSEDAKAALMALVEAGLARYTPTPPGEKGGRPSEVYTLIEGADDTPVDSVDSRHNPLPQPEKGFCPLSTVSTGGSVSAMVEVTL
jgi:hypothetical protein